jgi:hypothetical protein
VTTPSDPQWGHQQGDWPQQGQPPYGQPQYGQPQQPPYGQPQYGQPQQPPYGQPQYGQPQQPQYGQPQQPWGAPPPMPLAPAPAKKGRGKLVAATVAAVVVIGGGVATYAAVSSSSGSGGSDNPKAAVQSLVSDLNKSDLIGVLDDLPPSERDAISKPFQQAVDSLKRNDVLRSDADLSNVSGVTVKTSNLTYADKTISINDHVQIVQLTGGHIALNADATKAPFTSDFLRAVAPDGLASATASTSLDISDVVQETGRPVRIATQKSGDKWYPSLLYTIADNAATSSGLQAPSAADRIPATGAPSADEAARAIITDLVQGDVEQAIGLLSPDELAVMHDYGKLIVDRAKYAAPDVQIKDLTFTDHPIDGGTRVVLKSVDVATPDAGDIKVTMDGDCANVSAQGESRRLCSSEILSLATSGPFGENLTAGQKQALQDLFSGLQNAAGIDMSQTDGKWYVNPIRTYFDLSNALLSGLKGDDGKQLLSLLNH